ncbi:hypothetical protein [Streptomyces sp. NPDC020141]|uniref:hypothetical protein n=1 Tax=Streptomyces sp. NPDC020141 TaxID=3365065 RepID=UPI0037874F0F
MSPQRFDTADEDPGVPLSPNTGGINAGSASAPRTAGARGRAPKRPPFGSYMEAQLQREFKVACVVAGIEMQDGLDQAVRLWLAHQQEQHDGAASLLADEPTSERAS